VWTLVKRRGNQVQQLVRLHVPPAGSEGQTQIPYYDVVLQPCDPELELKENVAYGPISV
jgi:hypothetical protein